MRYFVFLDRIWLRPSLASHRRRSLLLCPFYFEEPIVFLFRVSLGIFFPKQLKTITAVQVYNLSAYPSRTRLITLCYNTERCLLKIDQVSSLYCLGAAGRTWCNCYYSTGNCSTVGLVYFGACLEVPRDFFSLLHRNFAFPLTAYDPALISRLEITCWWYLFGYWWPLNRIILSHP